MKIFTDNPDDAPYLYYYRIIHIRVKNIGSKQAQDIELHMTSPGHFELWTPGADTPDQTGKATSLIKIPTLNAKDTKYLTYWPDKYDEHEWPLEAKYADGKVQVMEGEVYRDGTNLVFNVQKSVLAATALGGLIVSLIVVLFLARRRAIPNSTKA
jgi:hypothetical protein